MGNYWLSKSKIMDGLQCEKRLWMEMHRPEEGEFSEVTERLFSTGHRVGEVARTFFPGGVLIDTGRDLQAAIDKTRELLARPGDVTLFEPAFEHQGVLARADVLVRKRGRLRLVEVKAAGSVKDHYLQDVAIQYWVLRGAGYEPGTVLLEHIDTSFVYPGKGDYRGLFKLENLTREAKKLQDHVPKWIRSFRRMLGGDMPSIEIGNHCHKPHDCPFIGFCTPQDGPEYPISILPYGGRVVEQLREDGFEDLRDVPEDRLTRENHLRVWRITRSGQFEIDPDVAAAIAEHPYPRYYLDFETIHFSVPIWPGTRPYQQVPYQWSLHIERKDGALEHREFLDLSADSPIRRVAESLIAAAGKTGPVFAYSHFESTRLRDLAGWCPDLAPKLDAIRNRIVDLLALTRRCYYHPEMKGSWSIKMVLPTVAPELEYESLEVQDGGMAQTAYLEAIDSGTSSERREAIRLSLLEYCGRDTEGLVRLVQFFEKSQTAANVDS